MIRTTEPMSTCVYFSCHMVILNDVFVIPISLSHHPPYHGAACGINFQLICMFSSRGIWLAAETKVGVLSEYTVLWCPFLLTKCLNANMKALSVISGTSSKCTARTHATNVHLFQNSRFFNIKRSGKIHTCCCKWNHIHQSIFRKWGVNLAA